MLGASVFCEKEAVSTFKSCTGFRFFRVETAEALTPCREVSFDGTKLYAAGFELHITFQNAMPAPPQKSDELTFLSKSWRIDVTKDKIVIETDWLGLETIFFNKRQAAGGTHHTSLGGLDEIDSVGLDLYLRYGYCALGKTPFQDVGFLEATNQLVLEDGACFTLDREDPFLRYTQRDQSCEAEVVELLKEWFVETYGGEDSDLTIPLTAGFDSRFLTAVCREVFPGRNIISPTYGVSAIERFSYDVIGARRVSRLLKTNHEFVPISAKHWDEKIEHWISLRGFSSHAHGMHSIDFHTALEGMTNSPAYVSGIYGDLWAGNHTPSLNSSEANDFEGYFLPHGNYFYNKLVSAEARELVKEAVWSRHEQLPKKYADNIFLARNKIILINYLIGVPDSVGFDAQSPFVDPKIAAAMMSLPSTSLTERTWQKNYFRGKNILVRLPINPVSRSNVLFNRACLNTRFCDIDHELFQGHVKDESYKVNGFWGVCRKYIDLLVDYVAAVTKMATIIPFARTKLSPTHSRMKKYYTLMPIYRLKTRVTN